MTKELIDGRFERVIYVQGIRCSPIGVQHHTVIIPCAYQ